MTTTSIDDIKNAKPGDTVWYFDAQRSAYDANRFDALFRAATLDQLREIARILKVTE